jgi:predicted Zn-dependent peptidase
MNHAGKVEEDNPINVAHLAALDHRFLGTPYTGSVYGSKASLDQIKKRDIQDFYKKYFRAENMFVAVISDMEKDDALGIIREYLEKFPPGKPAEPNNLSITPMEKKKLSIEKETKQSLVGLFFPLKKLTSKNYILAHLLNSHLGKGPDSVLWALREEKKLAYNVNSRITLMQEGGILEAYLETDQTKEQEALEALRELIQRLHTKRLTDEDLAKTKIQAKASFLRENETKEFRAHTLVSFEALGLGYGFFNRYLSEIDKISLEDMNAFITEVVDPKNSTEIIVGPAPAVSQKP